MSLLSFIEQLATAGTAAQPTARRGAMTQLARTAAAALPAVLGGWAAPAAAQATTGTPLDALQVALGVEWLQDEFYGRVLGTIAVSPPVAASLVPAALLPDLTLIRSQQRQHIQLLENIIRTSGSSLPTRPNYDFTGSRNGTQAPLFANVFSNTDTMLAVAQALEDLGVRTYTGQAALLLVNNDLLDVAVRALAVEGRHAAHLRQLRRQRGATVKNWISGTDGAAVPTAAANIYAGEDRVLQQVSAFTERDVTTLLPTTLGLSDAEKQAAATEAFDEPLSARAIGLIIDVFTY
ncbi:hypothetical protein GCM10027048_31430 [Hymenobacter coalescens]